MQQRDCFLHERGEFQKTSTIESGGLKELEFGVTSPCISRRGIGVD